MSSVLLLIALVPTCFLFRKTSIDMRYSVYDPPKQEGVIDQQNSKFLLSVDEAYSSNRFRRKSCDYSKYKLNNQGFCIAFNGPQYFHLRDIEFYFDALKVVKFKK